MRNYLIIILVLITTSCVKKQHGCVLNRTGLFEVNNHSNVTTKFVLIQKYDTIRENILPWTNYTYTIKAGVVTKAVVYVADTIYRESRDGWKIKRCELDGDLIRF